MVETNEIHVFDSVLSWDKSTENPAKTVYSLQENRWRDDSIVSGKVHQLYRTYRVSFLRNLTHSFNHQTPNFL